MTTGSIVVSFVDVALSIVVSYNLKGPGRHIVDIHGVSLFGTVVHNKVDR